MRNCVKSEIVHMPPKIEAENDNQPRPDINEYIHDTWQKLSFTHEDLFLGGARDTLLPHNEGDPYYVYVSDKEDLEALSEYYANVRKRVINKIRKGEITDFTEDDVLDIKVSRLPRDENGKIHIKPNEHGILHIPQRGVSPGLDRYSKGTFYNWDSAFMIRGMIQDGMADLAKDMLDNLLYEIDHYNGPMNANSTFCLSIGEDGELQKPRSQLPLVASKALIIYRNWDQLDHPPKEDKDTWLKRTITLAEKHHKHWMTPPHYDERTGLSKFSTDHTKPGVEVLYAEPDHYRHAYETLRDMFERSKKSTVPLENRTYQERKDAYYAELYLQKDANGKPVQYTQSAATGNISGLTEEFFKGDWAMRESGFDPSRRFGFMNVDIINHIPVCLNAFRKKMEDDLSELHKILSEKEPNNPQWSEGKVRWKNAAEATKKAIQEHLWDDGAPQFVGDDPMNEADPMPASYRDLNINPLADAYQIGKFRRYNFITASASTLWAGITTKEQTAQIIERVLPLLESEYGIKTSTRESGCQWDGEISFSPNEIMMAEGAEKGGYYHTALRLRKKRVRAIEEEYERSGYIWEKMEVALGTHHTSQHIGDGIGYAENDRGFGWTIAEYIDAKKAIVRLEKKIACEVLEEPCITTSFMVKAKGIAEPAKDAHLAHLAHKQSNPALSQSSQEYTHVS